MFYVWAIFIDIRLLNVVAAKGIFFIVCLYLYHI